MAKARASLETSFPNVAAWLDHGWIEVGHIDWRPGFRAMAYDEGGLVWEGEVYDSWDQAMTALDKGVKLWIDKHW